MVGAKGRAGLSARWAQTAALLAVAALGACTPFDLERPELARVSLNGPAGTEGRTVKLVTSSEFQVGTPEEGIVVLSADTVLVTLPFEADLPIEAHEGRQKLYLEAHGTDDVAEAVRLRVVIGSATWYDSAWDAEQRLHRFYYVR